MSARYALALCESCDGLGVIEGDKQHRDCPDCLGTGYAEPQKRILNLQSELSEMRYSRDEWSKECESNMRLLKKSLDAGEEAIKQRDTLVEALRNCMPFVTGDGCGEYFDAREALAIVKGGQHE